MLHMFHRASRGHRGKKVESGKLKVERKKIVESRK